MEELKKNRLDYAGSPPMNELPKEPFGLFKPDLKYERKVGRWIFSLIRFGWAWNRNGSFVVGPYHTTGHASLAKTPTIASEHFWFKERHHCLPASWNSLNRSRVVMSTLHFSLKKLVRIKQKLKMFAPHLTAKKPSKKFPKLAYRAASQNAWFSWTRYLVWRH